MINADVGTTDWREITENPDIDIVHICSPNDAHLEQLLAAMAHNKHIYCDKPITATADEAKTIEDALAGVQSGKAAGCAVVAIPDARFSSTEKGARVHW